VAGEEGAVRWSKGANRTSSRFRAVGGHLELSDSALSFRPHALDRALAGKEWSTPLSAIASVGVAERGGKGLVFGGAVRKRLRIELRDGSVELFVMNRLDQVVADVRHAVAAAG
jgi:hypothetical protein